MLGRWSGGNSPSETAIDRLPSSALAVGSLQIDSGAIYQALISLVPESEAAKLANLEIALTGIMLGQDLRTRILPGLGPRVIAYLDLPPDWEPPSNREDPARPWIFPAVMAVELRTEPNRLAPTVPGDKPVDVAAALDNALNTLLAVVALDEKHGQGKARISSREVAGLTVKTLDPTVPFAFAVDRQGHKLVVGTSSAAVERYLASSRDTKADARFRQVRSRAFPQAHSFLYLDMAAVQRMMAQHRDALAETIASRDHRVREEVARDLDQVLALTQLFDAAFLSNRVDGDQSTLFQSLGLSCRPGNASAATSPSP